MGRTTLRELRDAGITEPDIALAVQTQVAQRESGRPVLDLGVICGLKKPKAKSKSASVIDLTKRQLKQRGGLGQAALLVDQAALLESSPETAEQLRAASAVIKSASSKSQLEFDFFGGGNVSVAFAYHDAVTERLRRAAPTPAKMDEACSILWQITRHLRWQSYECDKSAAELCDILGKKPSDMAVALKLLEDVGAIKRTKKGRTKVIAVTPEGIYRGDITRHAEAVQRFKLEVIEGGRNV